MVHGASDVASAWTNRGHGMKHVMPEHTQPGWRLGVQYMRMGGDVGVFILPAGVQPHG